MKFLTLATALSILSVTSANIVYVTQTHITTLYDGAQPTTPAAAPTYAPADSEVVVTTIIEGGAASPTSQAPAPAPVSSAQAPAPQAKAVTTSSSSSFTPTTLVTSAAPAASSSSSDSGIYADINDSPGIDKSFATAILDAHNQKRALHSAPDLSWDTDLYNYASAYASKYDCSGSLTHSGGPYGENLAVGYADGPSAVTAWYDEGNNYDYSSASTYDHFTQVVWKSTTKLGCAYKDCSAENWGKYIICSYDPAGNFIGQAKANVLPN